MSELELPRGMTVDAAYIEGIHDGRRQLIDELINQSDTSYVMIDIGDLEDMEPIGIRKP